MDNKDRTIRSVALSFAALGILLAPLIFFWCISKTVNQDSEVEGFSVAWIVAVLTVCVAFLLVAGTAVGLLVANNSIFSGSGRPFDMAQMLYQSFFLQSLALLAVFIVGAVLMLISLGVVTPAEGLPIIAAAGGFALGRQFKPHLPSDS